MLSFPLPFSMSCESLSKQKAEVSIFPNVKQAAVRKLEGVWGGHPRIWPRLTRLTSTAPGWPPGTLQFYQPELCLLSFRLSSFRASPRSS